MQWNHFDSYPWTLGSHIIDLVGKAAGDLDAIAQQLVIDRLDGWSSIQSGKTFDGCGMLNRRPALEVEPEARRSRSFHVSDEFLAPISCEERTSG